MGAERGRRGVLDNGEPHRKTADVDTESEGKFGAEMRPSRLRWGWLYWPFVVVGVYILSSGPYLMWEYERATRSGTPPYRPLFLCYKPIMSIGMGPMGKPLRIYWHVWVAGVFDSRGNYGRVVPE